MVYNISTQRFKNLSYVFPIEAPSGADITNQLKNAALQAAVYGSKAVIYLPVGNFKIGVQALSSGQPAAVTKWSFPAGITLLGEGPGSTILTADQLLYDLITTGDTALLRFESGCTIEGFTVDGQRDQLRSRVGATYHRPVSTHGIISIEFGRDAVFRGLEVKNTFTDKGNPAFPSDPTKYDSGAEGFAIWAYNNKNYLYDAVNTHHNDGTGISPTGNGSYGTVQNSESSYNGWQGASNHNGGTVLHQNCYYHHNSITGCANEHVEKTTFVSCRFEYNKVGCNSMGASNLVELGTGNIFLNNDTQFSVIPSAKNGKNCSAGQGCDWGAGRVVTIDASNSFTFGAGQRLFGYGTTTIDTMIPLEYNRDNTSVPLEFRVNGTTLTPNIIRNGYYDGATNDDRLNQIPALTLPNQTFTPITIPALDNISGTIGGAPLLDQWKRTTNLSVSVITGGYRITGAGNGQSLQLGLPDIGQWGAKIVYRTPDLNPTGLMSSSFRFQTGGTVRSEATARSVPNSKDRGQWITTNLFSHFVTGDTNPSFRIAMGITSVDVASVEIYRI